MSYVALYRKWRPDVFSEVKGQEHVVTTLKNQLVHDRIGHAYMFHGTRGTGKTTMAKLFAKAVNCEHRLPDGSPCNTCDMCQAIARGNSMNVIEIDAASNNGVDNIREIRDEVQYSPAEGKYKVYIIDEAHMLSAPAFNALLKTLEEPPSYVIFILATTDTHTIPVTILSRCQKYDFHRISIETISERLSDLLQRENVAFEEKAIHYIAKVGDGSMRDALSILDQCIAFLLGEKLTYDKVLDILGAVDIEIFDEMLGHIWREQVVEALGLIDKVMWQGRDLNQFVTDFIWYLRNLLLVQSGESGIEMIDVSSEYKSMMLEKSQEVSQEALMRYIRDLSEVSNNMRFASQKRVVLEIAIMKLCKPQTEKDYLDLADRVRQLEKRLEEGDFTVKHASGQPEQASQNIEDSALMEEFDIESALDRALAPADAAKVREVSSNWSAIRGKVGYPMSLYLQEAELNLGEDGQSLVLMYPNAESFGYMKFSEKENLEQLQKAVGEVTGVAIDFHCQYRTSARQQVNVHNFNLAKLNINIEYED